MERIPTPRDLRAAAGVAQTLAYVSGLAGVIAGGVLFQQGDTAFAIVAWVLAFAAGAVLMIAGFLARAIAALLARVARIESDVGQILADRRALAEDPWSKHPPPY